MRSSQRGQRQAEPVPGSDGFTLVELLVTVAVLVALTLMASSLHMGHVRTGEDAIVRNNLTALRGAVQRFYLDHGRFPYAAKDHHDNSVGFLDDATSELVQGPHRGKGVYPSSRIRYLNEIPIDPSMNSKNWTLLRESFRITSSAPSLEVVTNVRSANPLYAEL